MSALRDALVQYVALRRALGTQLQEPAMTLVHFLEFLERDPWQGFFKMRQGIPLDDEDHLRP